MELEGPGLPPVTRRICRAEWQEVDAAWSALDEAARRSKDIAGAADLSAFGDRASFPEPGGTGQADGGGVIVCASGA